jgi:hypothetical protein
VKTKPLFLASVLLAASCSDDGTRDENEIATSGTLTLIREKSFADLVGSAARYEASGIVLENGSLRVVFDNSTRVADVDVALSSAALGTGDEAASQYEGVTVATRPSKRTYVVTEGGAGDRSAILTIDERGKVIANEPTDVSLVGDKGLEGIAWLDDVERMLVLCEANSCGTGDVSPGHGIVRSLRHQASSWVTEATLPLPKNAAFTDYSDLAVFADGDGRWRVAVLSQESAALWLGSLTTNPLAIVDAGTVYGFPTAGGKHKTQYCSLEGVTFLDASTIAVVSDLAKKSDDCTKAEAVHVFAIP